MRLIDADSFGKKLHEIGGCGAPPESWAAGWDKAIDEAINLLVKEPEVHKEPQWIPVTERLPDGDTKVLCCTITSKGSKNIVLGYWSGDRWACGMNSNVIAWMPLPEAYEEDT